MDSELTIDVNRLAWLPIAFLAEQDSPSEQLAVAAGLDEGYREVVTTGLWAYLLHSYLTLVQQCFGESVARLVRGQQRMILRSELAGSAAVIETALALIDQAGKAGPVDTPGRRSGVAFSSELDVSMLLLLCLPGSPDYRCAGEQSADRAVHRLKGIDLFLARLLARRERELRETLLPVFDRAAVPAGRETLQ